jgi:transposase
MLTDTADYVLGVDTHADSHAFALVESASGSVLVESELPACREGYEGALELARSHASGRRVWAIEGCGSYGAGLARFLHARGERVLEVERPRRVGRRAAAKSDALDALRAARALLAGESLAEPRAGEEREALRVLLVTREAAVCVRRAALNELRALLVSAPEELRERLRSCSPTMLVRECLRLRPDRRQSPQLRATRLALRLCARRAQAAREEAHGLEREIRVLVEQIAPGLLRLRGVGPISAGFVLLAWSHPGRVRSEAAFARLAGSAPLPASSGRVVRYRLDRGGDRRLNRALHTIVLSRRRTEAATAAYIERRIAEGKSEREAVRCLKRYLARSLFRALEGGLAMA